MKAFKVLLEYMGKFELGLSCFALIVMTLLYGSEIVSRWFFSGSVIFVQEVTMIFWVWLVFMAASYTFKIKAATVMEIVFEMFPKKIQKILEILVCLVTMVFCFFVVKESVLFFEFQRENTTDILDLPSNIFLIPVTYAGVSIFLTNLYDTAVCWKDWKLSGPGRS